MKCALTEKQFDRGERIVLKLTGLLGETTYKHLYDVPIGIMIECALTSTLIASDLMKKQEKKKKK